MIEKMKFLSITGPKADIDRVVDTYLSRYEIHLENALTELKSVSKLIPCPGTNPYREPYEAAEKLTALCSEGTKAVCTPSPASMTAEEAIAFVQETKKAMEAADAEKEALKQKLKDTHALYEQVNLYRELDFSIPELLKFRHIKYRFGRVLKELYSQLEAFAESSEDTILYKCHETDHYVTLIYFVPGPVSERIDAAFSSLQFERIILPDQYTGTPTEEIRSWTPGKKRIWRIRNPPSCRLWRSLAPITPTLTCAAARPSLTKRSIPSIFYAAGPLRPTPGPSRRSWRRTPPPSSSSRTAGSM